MGSHILRNNNLAQEIQNGSGLSGSGNVVSVGSVGLSKRAEASRGQGISPAVKNLTSAYFYCFYRKQKENAELKIFLVSPPTNDIYLESLNAVKCNLTELTTRSASVILLMLHEGSYMLLEFCVYSTQCMFNCVKAFWHFGVLGQFC